MPHDDVIEQLRRIGMSGYEAKAYLALIAAGEPLNGYELAKRSSVPRSTVYETVSKLVGRGSAFEVNVPDGGIAYLPLPVESLLARVRREMNESLDVLALSLPGITAPAAAHLTHQIRGRQRVLDRAVDVIYGAKTDLLLSVWPQEVPALLDALADAQDRSVDVSILVFGETTPLEGLGTVFEHVQSPPAVVLERLGCRLFAFVADRSFVLTAGAVDDEVWGMWCDDPAMALVVAEYIRHDMAIQAIFQRGDTNLAKFWKNDPALDRLRRDVGSPGLAAFGAKVPPRTKQSRRNSA